MKKLETPVAFFIFNRPSTTLKVFEVIRNVKPTELFIIADGPRVNNDSDNNLCFETRNIAEKIDWDCKVYKDYSDNNLGLRRRISSGLNRVFEKVEKAIILEDDCVPHPSFFRFCDELLTYYIDDEKIMSISGGNFLPYKNFSNYSYWFSSFIFVWGWATWRRAWKNYNDDLREWPELKRGDHLYKILKDKKSVKYWNTILQEVYEEKINSWAYRWQLSCWQKNGLAILPSVNLVTNIGFGSEATNTKGPGRKSAVFTSEEIAFPLKHPPNIERNEDLDMLVTKKKHRFSTRDKSIRVVKKILGL